MTRRRRIPARECTPGTYVSRSGRAIEIVDIRRIEKKATQRRRKARKRGEVVDSHWKPWPRRPSPDHVPYRAKGNEKLKNPLWRVSTRGWLPPDYKLLPRGGGR